MPGFSVFITGGTGYMGQRLIPRLLTRGHRVRALARSGSEGRLPRDCTPVIGNALDASGWQDQIQPADTFVQLIGTPHPSSLKAKQFQEIDLVSVRASVAAAKRAGIGHFVYVSVAQPAPVMKVYQQVRAQGEALIRESGMRATILRPWYVLGPGHWWPYALVPIYRALELWPSTRESARRLGLISLEQMLVALVHAVENPADGVRVVEVPEMKGHRL